ncbi:MAG: CoA-binding protein [Flavobacteriales bacterium]
MKKTLVLGASLKPVRYSNIAIHRLLENNLEVVAIGLREGFVKEIPIIKNQENFKEIHTITLYLNAKRQKDYYNYILSLKPKRVIFNPGTENPELYAILQQNKINFEVACTLVLLRLGQY